MSLKSKTQSVVGAITGLIKKSKFDTDKGIQVSEEDVFRIVNAALIADKFKLTNSFIDVDRNNYFYCTTLEPKEEAEKYLKFVFGNKYSDKSWYMINCGKFVAKIVVDSYTNELNILFTSKPNKLFLTLLTRLNLRYGKLTELL